MRDAHWGLLETAFGAGVNALLVRAETNISSPEGDEGAAWELCVAGSCFKLSTIVKNVDATTPDTAVDLSLNCVIAFKHTSRRTFTNEDHSRLVFHQ
jgi:hypothetical protein